MSSMGGFLQNRIGQPRRLAYSTEQIVCRLPGYGIAEMHILGLWGCDFLTFGFFHSLGMSLAIANPRMKGKVSKRCAEVLPAQFWSTRIPASITNLSPTALNQRLDLPRLCGTFAQVEISGMITSHKLFGYVTYSENT